VSNWRAVFTADIYRCPRHSVVFQTYSGTWRAVLVSRIHPGGTWPYIVLSHARYHTTAGALDCSRSPSCMARPQDSSHTCSSCRWCDHTSRQRCGSGTDAFCRQVYAWRAPASYWDNATLMPVADPSAVGPTCRPNSDDSRRMDRTAHKAVPPCDLRRTCEVLHARPRSHRSRTAEQVHRMIHSLRFCRSFAVNTASRSSMTLCWRSEWVCRFRRRHSRTAASSSWPPRRTWQLLGCCRSTVESRWRNHWVWAGDSPVWCLCTEYSSEHSAASARSQICTSSSSSLVSSLSKSSTKLTHRNRYKQDAQLSQRDRAAGCVRVLAKSGRPEPGYNILRKCAPYMGSPFQAELMLLGYLLPVTQYHGLFTCCLLMMCVWRIKFDLIWLKVTLVEKQRTKRALTIGRVKNGVS